ncbi:hypothetical protein ACWCQ0_45365 [Streptomyces massasporeus]
MPALVEGDDAMAAVPEQPGGLVPLAGVPGEPVEEKNVATGTTLVTPVGAVGAVTPVTPVTPVTTREPHAVTDHEPL